MTKMLFPIALSAVNFDISAIPFSKRPIYRAFPQEVRFDIDDVGTSPVNTELVYSVSTLTLVFSLLKYVSSINTIPHLPNTLRNKYLSVVGCLRLTIPSVRSLRHYTCASCNIKYETTTNTTNTQNRRYHHSASLWRIIPTERQPTTSIL